MNTYGGVAPPFLTSALGRGEWSASRSGRFTPRERAPRYPLDRRLGGPQNRSGRRGEEQKPCTAGNRTRAVQPVAIPTPLRGMIIE
jgi:hypothetical protein